MMGGGGRRRGSKAKKERKKERIKREIKRKRGRTGVWPRVKKKKGCVCVENRARCYGMFGWLVGWLVGWCRSKKEEGHAIGFSSHSDTD